MQSDTAKVAEGVVVADVAPDSLAANFGVQKGDVVVEVNGAAIQDDARPRTGKRPAHAQLGPDDLARRPVDPLAHWRVRFESAELKQASVRDENCYDDLRTARRRDELHRAEGRPGETHL